MNTALLGKCRTSRGGYQGRKPAKLPGDHTDQSYDWLVLVLACHALVGKCKNSLHGSVEFVLRLVDRLAAPIVL